MAAINSKSSKYNSEKKAHNYFSISESENESDESLENRLENK